MKAGVYRHYKGGYYQVLGIAANSTNDGNEELMVVYISLTGAHLPGPRMRVRSLDEFLDNVSDETLGVVRRFTYVGNEIPL